MRFPTSCLAPLFLALLLGSVACEGRKTTTRTVTTRTVTTQPNVARPGPAAAPPPQLVRVDSSAKTETSTTPGGGALEWLKVVLDFLAKVAWPMVALVGVAITAKYLPRAVPILLARLRRDEVTLQAGSLKITLSKSKEALAPMEVRSAPAGGAVLGAVLEV